MSDILDDLDFLAIESAANHLKATVKRALVKLEQKQKVNHAEELNEVRALKRVAEALQLDVHILNLYLELEKGGASVFAPKKSGAKTKIMSVLKTVDKVGSSVKFEIDDNEYELKRGDSTSCSFDFDGQVFGYSNLALLCNDQRVFSVHFDHEGEAQNITDRQITGFIVGDWVYEIINAVQTLQIEEKLKEIDNKYSPQAIQQMKERFGL